MSTLRNSWKQYVFNIYAVFLSDGGAKLAGGT
jgi:hypothetical protein